MPAVVSEFIWMECEYKALQNIETSSMMFAQKKSRPQLAIFRS